MRTSILIAGAVAVLIAAVESRDAYACGGCVAPPTSSTQVSGHRMILSISTTQTTLWDQLAYVGDASEFAWVLPIHGQVDIGLSSDLLFGTLDQLTDPRVVGGSCPPPPFCNGSASAATGGGMSTGSGVTVIAEEVVGPYETVQLAASDPTALQTWLDGHGYVVPSDVQSVVAQYVNEGFDFLAMRLVPGQGTAAMRPVRITSPGAGLALPLRMVAVGSGAITPIKLWVFGEGRYTAANAPTFLIDPAAVTYDYAQGISNMSTLRAQGFAASQNLGWLVNSASAYQPYEIFSSMQLSVDYYPAESGYGDDAMGTNAAANFLADQDALIAGINGSPYVTRLDAELSREGLKNDLALGASANQTDVSNVFFATNSPTCPPPPGCPNGASGSGANGSSGGLTGGAGGANSIGMSGGGCSAGGCATGGAPAALGGLVPAALALALLSARRRASPSRASRGRRRGSPRATPRA